MRAFLVLAGLADVALGVLLIAVSGFVLQGVYNTGPMMPEAVFYVIMMAWCFLAPLVTWLSRSRLGAQARVAIILSPLAVAGIMLLISPG
ncbi:MAG: hypothetical protein EP307_11330 [Rhodobacteraceae bacterium]|nr:MAG: hypothetical protein EP307_11330 [Paracoccaceae bacterium]